VVREADVTDGSPRATFLALSAALTGFGSVELEATGLVDAHLEELAAIVGDDTLGQLLGTAAEVLAAEGDRERLLARRILAQPRLGPVARNLVVLWYLGQWDQLPQDWRDTYGASPLDTSRVVSAAAYREGLVWPAVGAHPMGAKPTGYASWASRPDDLLVDPGAVT
jgi:hypothetical protein